MRRMPILLLLLVAACATTGERAQREAIARVIAEDAALGTARNHHTETMPIAEVVRAYAAELHALDYRGTPPEFESAFRAHAKAWEDSIEFFEGFPELRGEMHDVFEEIRAQGGAVQRALEAHEAAIWGTWAEVEAAADLDG